MFLIHFEDPGAYNLSADYLRSSNIFQNSKIFLSGWASKHANFNPDKVINSLEIIDLKDLDFIVLTATVDHSNSRLLFNFAKKNHIFIFFIIDHPYNFESCAKFIDHSDYIIASKKALDLERVEKYQFKMKVYEKDKLVIRPNSINKVPKKILFLSEPISEDLPSHDFNEIQAIKKILNFILNSCDGAQLIIRPHPRCTLSKYSFLRQHEGKAMLSKHRSLEEDIASVDLVLGISTMALEHSLDSQIKTYQLDFSNDAKNKVVLPSFINRNIDSDDKLEKILKGDLILENEKFSEDIFIETSFNNFFNDLDFIRLSR